MVVAVKELSYRKLPEVVKITNEHHIFILHLPKLFKNNVIMTGS